jgi:hypothetical protein
MQSVANLISLTKFMLASFTSGLSEKIRGVVNMLARVITPKMEAKSFFK